MKNTDKKAIIFLIIMLLSSLIFVSELLDKTIYIVIYWAMLFIFSIFVFGYQKDRTRYKLDYIQIIIIYTLLYLIVSYLGGLVFGFSRVPYSMEPLKILKNISFPLMFITFNELLRNVIIKDRGKYKTIFIMVALTFSLIEIFMTINSYDLNSAIGIFEVISILIIPSISKNLVLTYLTSNCGIYPSLIYHLITELYVFFIPIVPDYGMYISSIISIIIPAIIYLKFNTLLSKRKFQSRVEKVNFRKLLYLPIVLMVLMIVLLVSGLIKHVAISIGSGSMEPNLNIGDVVILEKLNDDELYKISVGDILVYNHDSKIIVHRVTKIKETGTVIMYRTKGDNNKPEDDYDILKSDIIGVVIFKIPYIGYPSVWLSRKFN